MAVILSVNALSGLLDPAAETGASRNFPDVTETVAWLTARSGVTEFAAIDKTEVKSITEVAITSRMRVLLPFKGFSTLG